MSEGGGVGEEECRDGGAEPQINGRKRGRMRWTGEEVRGGVGMGITVATDVGGGFSNAVKEGVEKLAKVRAELSQGSPPGTR